MLTAVGWVGGTLPELYEDKGMVELSMADVAGGGFAVGMPFREEDQCILFDIRALIGLMLP